MIVVGRAATGTAATLVTAKRPLVYLDHGPMGQIADSPVLARRLVWALRNRGGTLALSMTNAAEIGNQGPGPSSERVRRLLKAIGFAFCITIFEPEDAAGGNVASWGGADALVLDRKAAAALARWAERATGRVSAQQFVDWSLDDSIEVRRLVDSTKETLHQQLSQLRERYVESKRYPPFGQPRSRINYVWTRLLIELLRHGGPFERNDGLDLLHAAVPIAVCDFVLLDKDWAARARRVRPPERRAEVFSGKKGQIDAFLSALESWPSPPPEAK